MKKHIVLIIALVMFMTGNFIQNSRERIIIDQYILEQFDLDNISLVLNRQTIISPNIVELGRRGDLVFGYSERSQYSNYPDGYYQENFGYFVLNLHNKDLKTKLTKDQYLKILDQKDIPFLYENTILFPWWNRILRGISVILLMIYLVLIFVAFKREKIVSQEQKDF